MDKKLRNLMDEIVEKIQKTANAKAVFGDPVKEKDITLIPVARIRYCSGFCSCGKDDEKCGGGGGFGVSAKPVGYILAKDGDVHFKEIKDNSKLFAISIAALIGFFLIRR